MPNRNDDFNANKKATGTGNPVNPKTTPGTTTPTTGTGNQNPGNRKGAAKTGNILNKDLFEYEVAQEIGLDLPTRNQ